MGGERRAGRGREAKLELYEALGIVGGDVVAFVGAGGKSSAILQVTRELKEAGVEVLVAPTTKMFVSEAEMVGPILTSENKDELLSKAADVLDTEGAAVVGSTLLSKGRVGGVEASWVSALAPEDGVTLVEADGARRRPIKGTAAHEPLLPEKATLVVAVGGLRALGEPVGEKYVHRPEIFSELTGTGPGHTIDPRAFAQALLAGLRSVPVGTRRAALLADFQPDKNTSEASVIAHQLRQGGVHKVVLSSLPQETPGRAWTLLF